MEILHLSDAQTWHTTTRLQLQFCALRLAVSLPKSVCSHGSNFIYLFIFCCNRAIGAYWRSLRMQEWQMDGKGDAASPHRSQAEKGPCGGKDLPLYDAYGL